MVSPHDPFPTPDADPAQVQDDVVDSSVAEGAQEMAADLDGPRDVPRPIGPERLKALRAAIEGGSYPSDDDVAGGLLEIFRRENQ